MILHPDWRWIAKHSISFWLMGLAAILDVIGVLLPLYVDRFPRVLFAFLLLFVLISGMIARLVYQKSLSCGLNK